MRAVITVVGNTYTLTKKDLLNFTHPLFSTARPFVSHYTQVSRLLTRWYLLAKVNANLLLATDKQANPLLLLMRLSTKKAKALFVFTLQ